MITGPQLRVARISIGWEPRMLAMRAKVLVSVVMRAENSPGEPAVTIAQLNALMQALRAGGACLPAIDPDPTSTDGQL